MNNSLEHLQAFLNIDLKQNDLFLVLIFGILIILSAVLVRKTRVMGILLCIYIAYAIISFIPEIENGVLGIRAGNSFYYRLVFLIVLIGGLFFLLMPVFKNLMFNEESKSWQFIALSVLTAGLLISVLMSFMPSVMLKEFSVLMRAIFTDMWAKIFWLLTPIFLISYLSRRSD